MWHNTYTYIYIYVVPTCMWLERGALPLKTFHFRSTVQLKCMQQDAQETLRKVLSLSFFWFSFLGIACDTQMQILTYNILLLVV